MSNTILNNKNHPLLKWCIEGNLEKVKLFLDENPAFVNAEDENRTTPIMFAAQEGHEQILEYLIEQGADAVAVNSNGFTALMFASIKGSIKCIEKILANSLKNIDYRNDTNKTALMLAVENGHLECAKLLTENGANTEYKDKCERGLANIAALYQHRNILDWVLSKGYSNVSEKCSFGDSALSHASHAGDLATIKLLIEKYNAEPYDLGITKGTVLHIVAYEGYTELFDWFLENYLDKYEGILEVKDQCKYNVMDCALRYKRIDCVKILVNKYDVDIYSYGGRFNQSLYQNAVEFHHVEVAKFLLQKDPSLINSEIDRWSTLGFALSFYSEEDFFYILNTEKINAPINLLKSLNIFNRTPEFTNKLLTHSKVESLKFKVDTSYFYFGYLWHIKNNASLPSKKLAKLNLYVLLPFLYTKDKLSVDFTVLNEILSANTAYKENRISVDSVLGINQNTGAFWLFIKICKEEKINLLILDVLLHILPFLGFPSQENEESDYLRKYVSTKFK